jgi:hypothetical protein
VLRDATAVLFNSEQERHLARQSLWMYRTEDQLVGCATPARLVDTARQQSIFRQYVPQLRVWRILLFLCRTDLN